MPSPTLHPLSISSPSSSFKSPATPSSSPSSSLLSSSFSNSFKLSATSSMFSTPFILLTFSLLLTLPVLFFFFFSPSLTTPPPPNPISPSDELEDLALFTRASRLPSSSSHVSSRNPKLKIAFLFLTNSDLYFSPLWEIFFKGHQDLFNVYVHADPSANVTRPVSGVFSGRFIPFAKRTYRASPTLISATRRLLAAAILDDPANAFFAVLSQYCIPLHSFRYTYDSLVRSNSFDFSDPDPGLFQHGVRVGYKSYIEVLSKERRLWKRYVARGRYAMMPEVPFEKFRVGSQFFVLTRPHALAVIKDRKLWRKFKLPCYRADECYPEEHYFPTLLSMEDPKGLSKYTLTRVNWTGTVDGHPYTYKPSEITPNLIRDLRKSKYSRSYLFARKFSPDCLTPLLKIAGRVIFRD